MRSLLFALLISTALTAQVYPPGSPGLPPGQGGGIPNPFHKKDKGDADKLPITTGILFDIQAGSSPQTFSVQTKDKRNLIFQVTKTTAFMNGGKKAAFPDFHEGDEVEVESRADVDNNLFAVNVKLIRKYGEAPVEPPPTVLQRADNSHSSDAEDAPQLKRGKPKKKASDDDLQKQIERDAAASPSSKPAAAPAPQPESTAPAPVAETAAAPAPEGTEDAPLPPPSNVKDPDEFLTKAREAIAESLEKLPNFLCEQFTTRYLSERRPAEWMPQDVMSAKVIYEDGKETYQNIKLNNKPIKDPAKSGKGSWSTGEFGSWLADLFRPETAAHFHSGTNTTLNGRSARVYDFEVSQDHSHWKIMPPSQYYFPAYNGSVWLDKSSGRALRVECGAIDLPKEFPFDTAESTVDYDYVTIGTHRALLPVRAELLMCERGTTNCNRNVIEFRNYHQFGSETEIKIH